MRDIKPGEPVTYTEFAELAGRPAAVRAAATACARNPVGAVRAVPPGAATGRLARRLPLGPAGEKRWLLDHEQGRSIGGMTQPRMTQR